MYPPASDPDLVRGLVAFLLHPDLLPQQWYSNGVFIIPGMPFPVNPGSASILPGALHELGQGPPMRKTSRISKDAQGFEIARETVDRL